MISFDKGVWGNHFWSVKDLCKKVLLRLLREVAGGELRGGEVWSYFTLDDAETRENAIRDPEVFLSEQWVIIDEVQRVPEIFLAVKTIVNDGRHRGGVILTGSVGLAEGIVFTGESNTSSHLLKAKPRLSSVFQSQLWTVDEEGDNGGAYLNLPAFSSLEWRNAKDVDSQTQSFFEEKIAICRDRGYGDKWLEGALREDVMCVRAGQLWFPGYVQIYLEDLPNKVGHLSEYQRFMSVVVNQSGKVAGSDLSGPATLLKNGFCV